MSHLYTRSRDAWYALDEHATGFAFENGGSVEMLGTQNLGLYHSIPLLSLLV